MTFVLEGLNSLQQYALSWVYAKKETSSMAKKLGVVSSANINAAAIIYPSKSHPDVCLYGVASRDVSKAAAYARKYGFQKHYGSYQALLDDPDISIVYISLPNGMHFEWAKKAMIAGKHVLCEKPLASNAEEAKELARMAKLKKLVLEEALHWQFHPAAHKFREIIEYGNYGKILSTAAWMTSSIGIPEGDIRWNFDLGGGSLMDQTYALSFTRYAIHTPHCPKTVLSAVCRPSKNDPRVDAAMHAHLLFTSPTEPSYSIQSRIYTDMSRKWTFFGLLPRLWELPSIEVEMANATIFFHNALMPHLYHYISVTDKRTGKIDYFTQFFGGPLWGDKWTTGGKGGHLSWSTYRWQLEAFMDKIRGKEPPCWITNEDSISQMEGIDAIYKAAGLPKRGMGEKNG
ncbi:hypothetical protein LOZ20_002153 [Ophidiomyces ophidiicola]|uniref:Uncharacterized protein n=1 Tax=Ophidiomyces ophidiicola TaxID=1387563 RepID=A0ACB8V8V7_9EURO|nr:hypothetical protein LOZ60_000769 [Ophidiomyces ophidiicola]KAI2085424.1 hypothetical protein LOZ36_004006 [Ophidiomyces ophidiicola]KAI2131906.1 hypothetical protein LOZ31_000273 [Ophidiomyces ophidiicola]KAI2148069.1 hypothetical protein LOZ27_002099 [Ophidiomyces ophidiicola]KAI2198833.1 hypothetical protein LOZ20_002153 [Ophidiomyces ophidiicola]